eukprot:1155150-Pelagomonas_calceolata.AAC.17
MGIVFGRSSATGVCKGKVSSWAKYTFCLGEGRPATDDFKFAFLYFPTPDCMLIYTFRLVPNQKDMICLQILLLSKQSMAALKGMICMQTSNQWLCSGAVSSMPWNKINSRITKLKGKTTHYKRLCVCQKEAHNMYTKNYRAATRTESRYPLRSRGGRKGNREDSTSVTDTLPAYKVCHPSQFLPEQRHIHLAEVNYCENTRPKNQLEASKQQHRNIYCDLSRASAQLNLHTILLGVGGVIYTPHTSEPLKELGLDTQYRHQACSEAPCHAVLILSSTLINFLAPEALLRRLLSTLITKIRHGLLLVCGARARIG